MNFLDSFSKYHKIIILGGIFLASFSLIDKALAVGAIFVIFLSSITLFFINRIKEKETIKSLSLLFLIVFSIHIIMVVFLYYTNFQPFSDGRGDYTEYNFVAQEISKRVPVGNFSLEGLPLGHYYPVIIGYIYILTIPSMLIGQLFNAWLVALVAVFVYLIIRDMDRSPKDGFIAGLIVGFYPSLAFYGSLLLKDASIVLLSMVSLLLTLKIIKNFSLRKFVVFYIVLIGLTHVRFFISYALIFTFIISWFILSNLKIKKRIIYGIIMIILLGFLPRISPLDGASEGYMGIGAFRFFLSTKTITNYREVASPSYFSQPQPQPQLRPQPQPQPQPQLQTQLQTQPQPQPQTQKTILLPPDSQSSSIIIETGFNNPILFLKNISLSFIYSLLGPFPWQLTQKRHLFTLVEMIPWYFLLFFIIKGTIKSIRKEYKVILPLIIFSFAVFGILSVYINNFGIVTRVRMPAFLALLCLFPLGFEKLKNIKIPFFINKFIGISDQRKFLNEKVYPILEEKFLTGGKRVLDIGNSNWDYKKFFKKSEYIVSDIDEKLNPDIIDDIRNSKFKNEEFNLIIFNGVYEQIEGGEEDVKKTFKEIKRILKKDGVLILGIAGTGLPQYSSYKDTKRRIEKYEDALNYIKESYLILEKKEFFLNSKLSYLYLICRKL